MARKKRYRNSTYNEGKSAVAERFIRTLKTKSINIWFQYEQDDNWQS